MDSEIRKEQKRLAAKRFREKNPDKIKENNLNYYWNNREERLKKQKEYYQKNKDVIGEKVKERYLKIKDSQSEKTKQFRIDNPYFVKERDRRYYFKKQYNITIDDLKQMWESQDGLCANLNCLKELTYGKAGFAIDHCHNTGNIRGLLCMKCNVSLGNVNDSVDKLIGLIAYLKAHNGKV